MQYDFNDFVLVQAAYGLNSRSEVNLEYMPIFTAPMDTVVDENNAGEFKKYGINICFPRNVKREPNAEDFISVGLDGFSGLVDGEIDLNGKKICIDVANGNMPNLHNKIKDCKNKFPKSILMAGNVASEMAYVALSVAGCDYIRVGVGSGSGCLTSVHTGVGQGMATLIQRCQSERHQRNLNSFIVADGGFKSYRDIIMALAMGADYVMLGGILNKCLESCAEKRTAVESHIYDWVLSGEPIEMLHTPIEKTLTEISFNQYLEFLQKYQQKFPHMQVETPPAEILKSKKVWAKFRGMSTKAVQREWGREKLQSSEGIEKNNFVEYTLQGWVENFIDYLKSAMSYSGANSLEQFKNNSEFETISNKTFERFNK